VQWQFVSHHLSGLARRNNFYSSSLLTDEVSAEKNQNKANKNKRLKKKEIEKEEPLAADKV